MVMPGGQTLSTRTQHSHPALRSRHERRLLPGARHSRAEFSHGRRGRLSCRADCAHHGSLREVLRGTEAGSRDGRRRRELHPGLRSGPFCRYDTSTMGKHRLQILPALRGKPKRYRVHVSGPWHITFEWKESDAWRVDLPYLNCGYRPCSCTGSLAR